MIAAETAEAASQGILMLLAKRGIKNPVVINVEAEDDDQLELPLDTPKTVN